MATVPKETIEGLTTAIRGSVIGPDDAGYDEARAVYNGMIDKRPALVVRCADTADVIAAVRFARDNGLAVAVRGGGHNGAGLGTVDGGLVIDLGAMRGVRVDPAERTVQVEGGATLGDVDHATHAFGLAVPGGIISTTGIGGLTLGGGIGHLTRGFGLTIDNLIGADVVLADGSFVRADAQHNPDLFWALRGGGGNFGVVTSFTFRAQPVSTVVAGPMLYQLDDAPEVMRFYREFIGSAPRELGGFFAFQLEELLVAPGQDWRAMLRIVSVGGKEVNQVAVQPVLREVPCMRTESPRVGERRDLSQAATRHPMVEQSFAALEDRVPLGMGDDRNQSRDLNIVKDLIVLLRDELIGEFNQQVGSGVNSEVARPLDALLDIFVGKVKIATQQERQGIPQGGLDFRGFLSIYGRVERIGVVAMRRRHQMSGPIRRGHLAHLERFFQGFRAIV